MKVRKNSKVYKVVKVVGMAGAIGVVVVAPNSLQAFEAVSNMIQKKNKSKNYTDYLQRSGYFEVEKTGSNSFVIRLSAKGDKAYSGIDFLDYIHHSKKWDGTWHLLMFDISENYKSTRQYISRELNSAGLKPLQDSVFAYPYDLSDLANAIREEYPKIATLIISAKVVSIDGVDQLKDVFRSII